MINTKTVITKDGIEKEIVTECDENDDYCHSKCCYRQGDKFRECSLYPYNMIANAMVLAIITLLCAILILSLILK